MKNEFRQQFELHLSSSLGHKGDREELLSLLEALARALFLESALVDSTNFLGRLARQGDEEAIWSVYRALRSEGRIRLDAARGEVRGPRPLAFDLRRAVPFDSSCSLGELLTQYLASGVDASDQTAAVAAVRELLSLPAHSKRSAVLLASQAIDCRRFHGLPERYEQDSAERNKIAAKTRRNHIATLRRLIAFGLRHDLFALHFPARSPRPPWQVFIDQVLPLATLGASTPRRIEGRGGLQRLLRTAHELCGLTDVHLLTEDMIRRCWLAHSHRGQLKGRSAISRLVKCLPSCACFSSEPVLQLIHRVLSALQQKPGLRRLRHATDGTLGTQSTRACIVVLQSHGLPQDWTSFLLWYDAYSSLDWRELLDLETDFPERGAVRHLGQLTYQRRLDAICVYLEAARTQLPARWPDITPTDVFGAHFRALTKAILGEWERSAASESGASHRASTGVRSVVLAAGMLARALYDRAVHIRTNTRSST